MILWLICRECSTKLELIFTSVLSLLTINKDRYYNTINMKHIYTNIMVLAIGVLSIGYVLCPISEDKNKIVIESPKQIKIACLLDVLNQPDDPPSKSPMNSGASTYTYTVSAVGTTSPSPSSEILGTTTTT